MARYNQFQYGENGTYGGTAVTEAGALTWVFLVDWNDDGVYDGTNEMAWCKQFSMTRGRENYLSLEGNGFEHMGIDSATLVMDDPDRRYDPRNEYSLIYPDVYPGKRCQVAVYDNSVNPRVRYTRFTGYIDGMSQITSAGEVTITCKGNLQPLADQELTSQSAHINVNINECFVDLLNEAGYTGGINIDAESQPVVSFAVDGMSAAQVLGQLADAALGNFFVDAEGIARFYSRSHSYPAAIEVWQDECLKEYKISQPWDGVFKKVDVICRKQIREQPSVIFFLSNPLELDTGNTVYIYPSFQSSTEIAFSASEANSKADGTGTDILTSTSLAEFALGPMGGTLGFNTSAAGWLTKLEIRGRRWKEVVEKFVYSAASGKYDRKFILDTPWLQDRNYAASFRDTLWKFLDDDRESLVIGMSGKRPDLQFSFDLLTKVNFIGGTFFISDNYWITGIDEEWLSDTGQLVKTTFYLSKILTDSTSITPAPVEEEAPTPLGLDDPGGDASTGGSDPGLTSIPIYHNDTLVGNAEELNFLDS